MYVKPGKDIHDFTRLPELIKNESSPAQATSGSGQISLRRLDVIPPYLRRLVHSGDEVRSRREDVKFRGSQG